MESYILVLVQGADSETDRKASYTVWYPFQGRSKSTRMESEVDSITLAKELARVLGVGSIYVEHPSGNYLLKSDWITCHGLSVPHPPTTNLDVIAKGRA